MKSDLNRIRSNANNYFVKIDNRFTQKRDLNKKMQYQFKVNRL